ncbi:hypothetical protein PUN28_007264 [Cardiocondyla obscurior]
MKFSLTPGVALLLTVATLSFIQASRSQPACGSLGPGVNACKCNEVMVKAAKKQKPLYFATPEAINEAAVAREAVGRLSLGTNRQSGSVTSFPNYKAQASRTFSSSSGSFSSSSSAGRVGGLIGRSQAYLPYNFAADKVTSSCGCGKQSQSLRARDLLSSNVEGKIVPSFAPIGDLCYPNSPRSSKYQVTTKVTPAYPAKIKCAPSVPYEVCVQMLNGQIDEAGLRKLGLATRGKFGSYQSNNLARGTRVYGGLGRYGSYAGSSASSVAGSIAGSIAGSNAATSVYGYNNYAGSRAANAVGQLSSRSSNFQTSQGSTAGYRSAYGATSDCGNSEFSEDYSYPGVPADPVSVTLAYKNLLPNTVYYNRRTFVPEDKLAFGHRTVPIETKFEKRTSDIPEEKLLLTDKPVVELKPVPQTTFNVGVYDEHEEAKLAELEAIERERLNQEEIAEQQRESFITYG